jgi:hypothetical protein
MKLRSRRAAIGAAAGALAVAAVVAAPGPAQSQGGVTDDFSLIMMVHTSSSSFGNLPGVNPWGGVKRSGTLYRYRSIPCTGPAPVNNIASDLPTYGNRVANSRAPASMRAHPFQFRLVKAKGKWEMRGSITFTVCKLSGGPTPDPDPIADADKPKIHMRFRAAFDRVNGEMLNWHGTFRILGGTERYAGLTGSGSIAGYLFCFNPAGCTNLGRKYLDGQMVLHGRYSDPTPQLGS